MIGRISSSPPKFLQNVYIFLAKWAAVCYDKKNHPKRGSMMKKKSGFSMVELIIVIAVIAILAAILVPVFTNIIDKANESEAIQNARNAYSNYAIKHVQEDAENSGTILDLIYIQQNDRVIIIDQGAAKDVVYGSVEAAMDELCDNPDDYELVATEDDKLFIVSKK